MSARTKARKRALDILFQADVLQRPVLEILEVTESRALKEPERMASWLYAQTIVRGVLDNFAEIDENIESCATGWSLERMPNVDRAILRIAVWEVKYNHEVPPAVAIDEALELAKELSTAESPKFINGVLGRIADMAA